MSSYEEKILEILLKNKIFFQREKSFRNLKANKLRFDFFLPQEKILIEVQGEFHYHPMVGRRKLLRQQENDRRKKTFALAQNYSLYCIPYWEIQNLQTLDDLFQDKFLVKDKWHDDKNQPPKRKKK